MDSQWLFWFSAMVGSLVMYFLFDVLLMWRRKQKSKLPLPPGPPAWPVVGNLFQLGKKPNESLWALSQQYGPLMTLYLGMKTTVVVSSSHMAKEVLKTHDQVFAGRTVVEAAKVLSYHKSSIVWSQYGPYWRKLRRIATTQLLTPSRLQALQHLRRDQIFQTIRLIFKRSGQSLNIGHLVFYEGLNLMSDMIFSKHLFDPNNPEAVKFKEAFTTLLAAAGKPNLADCFPFLKSVDPQSVRRETNVHFKRVNSFLDVFIEDRLAVRSQRVGPQKDADKDFLDILLDLKDDDFTLIDIRAVVFELLAGGSDTSSATIEWAMAELIRNPHVMKRVQEELQQKVGRNRRVEESDTESLPYLQAVVKEVFRLHPAVPLTIPHRADSSCEVAGYMIPKHTEVIVNLWAISRDPAVWKEPLKFMPERFFDGENSKMDFKGQDFELLPFGAGRRICLGLPLADRMVHFTVASLIHSFNWTLPEGMNAEELDMSDTFGTVLKKTTELHSIPTPRLADHIY